jgi:hypothetical protein
MEGLTATIRGDPEAEVEKMWLQTPSESHVSVLWPEGFNVRFEPTAHLYDPGGTLVGIEGSTVHLDNVAPDSATGTFTDPYIATGRVFGRCYIYRPR